MSNKSTNIILGIESSCDDTAAAVCIDGKIVSNVVANQDIHAQYGGVVPELASRAHLSNIVPAISAALKEAGVTLDQLSAVAVTRGPGLLGSLVVGVCAAKGLASGLSIPIIPVNHMDAHIMSSFIELPIPSFPVLSLTVSGGHTQLTIVHSVNQMEVVGKTRDDAAGEAFDKIGKMMGLPYPAGPIIDRLAEAGQPRFKFTHADVPEFDFSFSGLKTQVMYFLRDQLKNEADFLEDNKKDVAASVRSTIVGMLMNKLESCAIDTGIKSVAIVGGVSANRLVRRSAENLAAQHGWQLHIPSLPYCTDNAAMIAITGYYRLLSGTVRHENFVPFTRYEAG